MNVFFFISNKYYTVLVQCTSQYTLLTWSTTCDKSVNGTGIYPWTFIKKVTAEKDKFLNEVTILFFPSRKMRICDRTIDVQVLSFFIKQNRCLSIQEGWPWIYPCQYYTASKITVKPIKIIDLIIDKNTFVKANWEKLLCLVFRINTCTMIIKICQNVGKNHWTIQKTITSTCTYENYVQFHSFKYMHW